MWSRYHPGSHLGDNLFFKFDANHTMKWASHMELVVKNPPANAGDIRDVDSIPGLGRSPGGGYGNLLQYSCLENPMDRGAWWVTVHGVTKSRTQLKQLSMHAYIYSRVLKLYFYIYIGSYYKDYIEWHHWQGWIFICNIRKLSGKSLFYLYLESRLD